MKKIFFAIAIMMMFGLSANAQGGRLDGFFNNWDDEDTRWGEATLGLSMPSSHIGDISNEPVAPLGSGLLVLTALGAGYAAFRKRK